MSTSHEWNSEVNEVVQNLSHLIQAQTINPPGNELPAILLVRDILVGAGIPD